MTRRVAALMYHDVTDEPTTSGFQRPGAWPYKLSRRRFDQHLAQLAAAAAAPVLVTDLALAVPGGGDHLMLTFDDGALGALHAADALSRRGWRAHFFIVTGLLGAPGFLSPADVRALRAAGHLIGSHSHTHPDIFRDLPPARMAFEWRTSRAVLEDLLGEPCLVASVPGGDSSPAVFRSAAKAGYRFLFTSEPWLRPRRVAGCTVLGRFSVKAQTPVERVAALAEYRGWGRALAQRRLQTLLRRAVPWAYRAYVRQRTAAPPAPAAPPITAPGGT